MGHSSGLSTINSHVVDYLDFYLKPTHQTQHAVMLTGTWGSGKTYFVNQYIAAKVRDPNTYIKVSLFGVTSQAEFRKAIFAAAYPMYSGKLAKTVSSLAKAALEVVNFKLDLDLSEILTLPDNFLIVIDDFERCSLTLKDALGLINPLVESDRLKVIILANETELPEDQLTDYRKRKEKVVGQTLAIKPDIEGALKSFISVVTDEETRRVFNQHRDIIISVYADSKVENLRILQQTLSHFERFYQAVQHDLPSKESGKVEMLKIFLALSFEYRAGKISASDIENRATPVVAMARHLRSKDMDVFDLANEKYPTLDLRDELFSNETLKLMLVEGHIQPAQITQDILRSSHFQDSKTQESWITVWWGLRQQPENFAPAVEEMNRKFAALEYRDPDEFLHVAMLQIWLCEIGEDTTPIPKRVSQIKNNIEQISNCDGWPKQNPGRPYRAGVQGAHGHGFQCTDGPEFVEIRKFLQHALDAAYKNSFSDWAEDLLSLLEEDPPKFIARICWTNNSGEDFISEPVLAEINPEDFLGSLLKQTAEAQHSILSALKERYARGELESRYPGERAWFSDVRSLLLEEGDRRSGIMKAQLDHFDRWYFAPILDAAPDEV